MPHAAWLIEALEGQEFLRGPAIGSPQIMLPGGQIVALYDAQGVPSETALLMAHVLRYARACPQARVSPVAGTEWQAKLAAFPELLGKAFPAVDMSRYAPLFTGMVTLAGRKCVVDGTWTPHRRSSRRDEEVARGAGRRVG